MTKIEELHYLVELLNKHGLPISPILEYAIKERKEQYANEEKDTFDIYEENSTSIKNNGFEDFCHQFENLSVGTSKGKKLPHKAIVLLSIMNLIDKSIINENCIELNETIVTEFTKTWKKYMGDAKIPSVWTPFWYLKSESFWHFKSNGDDKLLEGLLNFAGHPSIGQMRSVISYAYIETKLFNHMLNIKDRLFLQNILIKTYLKQ